MEARLRPTTRTLRPLLVLVALGLMAWGLALEARGPQTARPAASQTAHGHGVSPIREVP